MNIKDITNYTKMGKIPLTQEPSQEFQITLDGQNCTISIYQKDESVYMDLYVDETPIFLGVSCLDRVGIKEFDYMDFKGQLWFEDLNGTQNPDYSGFNTKYILYYGKQ